MTTSSVAESVSSTQRLAKAGGEPDEDADRAGEQRPRRRRR